MKNSLFNPDQLKAALLAVGVTDRGNLFAELKTAYGEPGRFYHTAEHVADCLELLERHRQLAGRPAEVEIAIWFHDAVYDARRSDNEDASAAWAQRYLASHGADDEVVQRAAEFILATKSHDGPLDNDQQLMVDIDLAILGQPPGRFQAYDQAIRQEYAWVPEPDYRAGRSAVLRRFLDRPHIYGTQTIRDLYESQARENIAGRLADLQG